MSLAGYEDEYSILKVKELLKIPTIDLNLKCKEGKTALAIAFEQKESETENIKLLKEAGATQVKTDQEYYDEYEPVSDEE